MTNFCTMCETRFEDVRHHDICARCYVEIKRREATGAPS